jgi:hypothetical protein
MTTNEHDGHPHAPGDDHAPRPDEADEGEGQATVPMSRSEFEVLRLTDAALHDLEQSARSQEPSRARIVEDSPGPRGDQEMATLQMDDYQVRRALEGSKPLSMDAKAGPHVSKAPGTPPESQANLSPLQQTQEPPSRFNAFALMSAVFAGLALLLLFWSIIRG